MIISFDVWNTLIKHNPKFSEERRRLLSRTLGMNEDIVQNAYEKVKRATDMSGLPTPVVYWRLSEELGCHIPASLRHKINDLFLRYPPVITAEVKDMVRKVSERHAIGIGSNSNFISGVIMHPFLMKEFNGVFQFSVYSDLVGVAKPDPRFFELVSSRAEVSPDNILHVGDSLVCDGGAVKIGMKFELIDNFMEKI